MILDSLREKANFQKQLFFWYQSKKRPLPWRSTKDPYRIWVSEIMLQQTQVATVIPYYERWLKAFPSLPSFARAPLSRALKHWAGLGYYRRVRMFHQAARYVQRKLRGEIPRTAEALRKLPGIGRYTAGAIASIALDEKTPILDGNVIRILTRIFAIPRSIDRPATLKRLWKISSSLLPEKNTGDFNQALMELGATICLPLNPKCGRCPVKKTCGAHRRGKELSFPVRSYRNPQEKLRMATLVLRNSENKIWLEKQPEHGRWGGLWMFPFWPNKEKMAAEMRSLYSRPFLFLTLRHAFTKYRIMLEVYEALSKKDASLKRNRGKWFPIAELARLALPSPHKKIAETLVTQKCRQHSSIEKGL